MQPERPNYTRRGNWIQDLAHDVRFAVRMLRKNPSFAAIAVLTLALGIGANTALFSVVNGVLLNPLAYPHSGQLVAMYGKTTGFEHAPISYLNFLDWQRDTQTFSSMAIYRNQDYNFTGTGEAERLTRLHDLRGLLSDARRDARSWPHLPRDDDQPGAAPVAILGGGFWKRKFGSSLDVIGKSMILNGTSYTIVGVIPAGFTFYGQRPRRLHAHRPVERPVVSRSPHRCELARSRPAETGRNASAGESGHGRHRAKSAPRLSRRRIRT